MASQSSNESLIVRHVAAKEFAVAVEWAAAEGWNPGRNDADCFHKADPNGLLLELLDDEPVASISAVNYDASFGFVGFYIVRPDLRGKGYGINLWRAAMNYLDVRTVGLDAVLAQQANYEASGFTRQYHDIRHQGVGGGTAPGGIVPLANIDFDELTAYDAPLFAVRRPAFLRGWISQAGAAAVAVRKGGSLAGYGVMRPCMSGFKIGPLFADQESLAETLFQAMIAKIPGQPVFLDVPETNPSALTLAKRHSMQPVFETVRMYNRSAPPLPVNRIYGVTSLELG